VPSNGLSEGLGGPGLLGASPAELVGRGGLGFRGWVRGVRCRLRCAHHPLWAHSPLLAQRGLSAGKRCL